jgi:hypothetical protein
MKPVGFPLAVADVSRIRCGQIVEIDMQDFIVTRAEKGGLTLCRRTWYNRIYCWIERSLKSLGL